MIQDPDAVRSRCRTDRYCRDNRSLRDRIRNPNANNARILQSTVGVASVADSRDFDDQRVDPNQADATVFAELGIAVTALDPSQLGAMRTSSEAQSAVASISPELIHHPLADTSYVAGYRDGASDLAERIGAAGMNASGARGGARSGWCRPIRRHCGQHVGPGRHPRHNVTAIGARYQGRRAGHRIRLFASGLRRSQHHDRVVRQRREPAGRARARNALHRDGLRTQEAVGYPPVRRGVRVGHLCR